MNVFCSLSVIIRTFFPVFVMLYRFYGTDFSDFFFFSLCGELVFSFARDNTNFLSIFVLFRYAVTLLFCYNLAPARVLIYGFICFNLRVYLF